MYRRESARVKGRRYKHLLYGDEEVDEEVEKIGRRVPIKKPRTKPKQAQKRKLKIFVEAEPIARKIIRSRKKIKFEEKLDASPGWITDLKDQIIIPCEEEDPRKDEGGQEELREDNFNNVANSNKSDPGYFIFPDVPPPINEKSDISGKIHAETPQFRDLDRFNHSQDGDDPESKRDDQGDLSVDFHPDVELKRAFSFSARNVKRPPELNIEMITHTPFHSPEFPGAGVNESARMGDWQRPQPLISPINAPLLSPLAMPGQGLSLANTPTMLNSFMNVLRKDPEPQERASNSNNTIT